MSSKRSNKEILDEWFERMVTTKRNREMGENTIRYDKERDAILFRLQGIYDYEIGRKDMKDAYSVCLQVAMLREKQGVTDSQIVDLLEEALAAPGFLT